MSKRRKVRNDPERSFDVEDINSEILEYVPPGGYIFFAPVSRSWSSSWDRSRRELITDVQRVDMSLSQIRECIDFGSETVTLEMLKTVAESGELALLKRMCLMRDCLIKDGKVLTSAVSSGNLEMVKWLFHEQECSTAWDPLGPAASRGDIDMYNWLREHGATRTWRTASMAASKGHLQLLMVIREDDCNDDLGRGFSRDEYRESVLAATRERQVEVVEWLQRVGTGGS